MNKFTRALTAAIITCTISSSLSAAFFTLPPEDRRTDPAGQSFMFTRPVYRNLAARQSNFWHDLETEKTGDIQNSIQAHAIFQESRNSDAAERYFLINQKNSLVVKGGDGTTDHLSRDIRAEWLGLPANFDGTFRINPHQQQWGFVFETSQGLGKFTSISFFEPMWINVAFAMQHVENNMRLTSTKTAGIGDETVATQFARTNQNYAKITGKQKKTGLAEIQIKVGNTFLKRNGFEITASSGIVIPTYKKQQPTFLFSPFLGHNGHFGLITAGTIQLPLNDCVDGRLVAIYLSAENFFFLPNFQNRSLDLKDKPYSKYMLLNDNNGSASVPAANILTRRVKVNSYNFVDVSAGLRISINNVEAEIGYNLWAHGNESLKLAKPFTHNFGVQYGIAGDAVNTTRSTSTISQLATANDTAFTAIKESDLDLLSGAARSAVTHRVHGALGLIFEHGQNALIGGIGAFVEIPQHNAALKNWGLWTKLGVTF